MKLRSKLLLPPLVTALVALTAGATYATLDWRQGADARAANAAVLAGLKASGQATAQLGEVRAEVFRTLALIASMDDAQVKAKRAELAQSVDSVKRVIEAMPATSGNDSVITEAVTTAAPLLAQYLKQTDKAIDLSGTDPNIGVGAMRAAEDTFSQLSKAMQAVVVRKEVMQAEHAETAAAASLRLTALLSALMLLATGGALFAAWRLQSRVVSDIAGAVRLSQEVAAGKLDTRAQSQSDDEIGDLVRSLGDMVDKLRGSMLTVRAATDHISTAAREIASGNTDLSQRTEQAASRVQQSASSMEELTVTVRQTADAARTANQLADSASTVAQRGGSVVAQVVTTMEDINSSSKKIADIIGTIDGIAFQTNILALNAAVEAARAGEQGRGFAVVASEVRSLAQRSAEAAREIKALIGASVDKVESGTRLVADAGSTMNEIVASVQRVTDIIGEISAATGEQSGGLGLINTAVADLDRMTQQNAALVEEGAAAAESLHEQASKLLTVVSGFQLGTATAAFTSPPALVVAKTVVAQAKASARTAATPPLKVSARPASKTVPAGAGKTATPAPAAPTSDNSNSTSTATSDSDWETF